MIEKYRMLGESETFLDCMQRVSRAAKVNRPILIIGERGTGKELVAARLHYLSPRWQQPRITINCAAFSKELLESELFGYEQGAFTGAVRAKPGRFELADQGSLFLDELANSPHALQEKLLRVLEYGEFERVGGVGTIGVDVRVIAATNQDLPTLCRRGRFKEDLLDRLSFEVITLPPLRSRIEDIPLMASNFAVRMAREMDLGSAPRFSRYAIESMMAYHWPGNVRELKNTVERAVYRSEGEVIEELELDPFASPFRPCVDPEPYPSESKTLNLRSGVADVAAVAAAPTPISSNGVSNLPDAVAALERSMIEAALQRYQFNQTKAAEDLGLSYYQLRRLIKKLGLSLGQDDEASAD
ncbi:phage shock protein operon transcriptional activator [Acanthopleuribacter pedis]|uniref:phage shock protein operon transcriptional activator n=1 Tax=Acanthopleuribacter pedis TaxID=442870 RepID=UPI003C6FAA2B